VVLVLFKIKRAYISSRANRKKIIQLVKPHTHVMSNENKFPLKKSPGGRWSMEGVVWPSEQCPVGCGHFRVVLSPEGRI